MLATLYCAEKLHTQLGRVRWVKSEPGRRSVNCVCSCFLSFLFLVPPDSFDVMLLRSQVSVITLEYNVIVTERNGSQKQKKKKKGSRYTSFFVILGIGQFKCSVIENTDMKAILVLAWAIILYARC